MLSKRIPKATLLHLSTFPTSSSTTLQLKLNNSSSTLIASKFIQQHLKKLPLASTKQFYTFCTDDKYSQKNFSKRGFVQSFGFSLKIEDFKLMPLMEKIWMYLKIMKLNDNSEMEIEELDKITKMKQVFLQEMNMLEINDQLLYFTYFMSAYKLWLYRKITSPYQQKQTEILEFRKLLPQVQTYFSSFRFNADQAIDLQFINTLLISLQCIPESEHPAILEAAIPFAEKLNNKTICIFLADASSNTYNIPKRFFDAIYGLNKEEYLAWPYIYYYLTFANKYQSVYYPLINFQSISRRCRRIFELQNIEIRQIFCYLETIKISFILTNQTHLKTFNNYLYYSLVGLEKQIYEKKYSIMDVVKICNYLAQIIPVGTRYLREIAANKSIRYSQDHIPALKQYVINQVNNLQPKYIYSIDELCNNQINFTMLFLLQILIKKIMLQDPYFILQLSNYYFIINQKIRLALATGTNQSIKKICENFTELSQENRQTHESVRLMKKVINFVYYAKESLGDSLLDLNIFFEEAQKFIIANYKEIDPTDTQILQFVYQVLHNSKSGDLKQLTQICDFLCINYIFQKMKESPSTSEFKINSSKPHEIMILRILSRFSKNSSIFNFSNKKLIAKFINTHFIYSVKSVKKDAIFDILKLCSVLKTVDVNVEGYLYNNLSSFVIYTQINKKFYLPKGPKSILKQKLILTLRKALKNYKNLRKIKQKDRLNILKVLALRFWNELSNTQILNLLIIFESPTYLSDKIKQLLREVLFTKEDIQSISEIEILRHFRFHNTELFKILQSQSKEEMGLSNAEVENYDLTELNFKSPAQLQTIFLNLELYEQLLTDIRLTCQENLPIPKTTNERINAIYACLKIFQKIRQVYDFRIKDNLELQKNTDLKNIINISDEISFIKKKNLVRVDELNSFKLGNISVSGNQAMIEGWYIYDAQDNLIEIEEFSNVGDTQEDNPYQKVLLSLFGDTGHIRQFTKHQTFQSDLVFAALQLNLQIDPKGSLVQIPNPRNKQDVVYILCSTESNYKIHNIFAYILKKVGFDAYIVTASNNKQQLIEFFIKRFNLNEEYLTQLRKNNEDEEGSEDLEEKIKQNNSGQNISQLSDKDTFLSD